MTKSKVKGKVTEVWQLQKWLISKSISSVCVHVIKRLTVNYGAEMILWVFFSEHSVHLLTYLFTGKIISVITYNVLSNLAVNIKSQDDVMLLSSSSVNWHHSCCCWCTLLTNISHCTHSALSHYPFLVLRWLAHEELIRLLQSSTYAMKDPCV